MTFFILVRTVLGLMEGAYTPTSFAAVAVASKPSRRGLNQGLQQCFISLMGLALAGCPIAGEPEYGVPDPTTDSSGSSSESESGPSTGEPEYGVPDTGTDSGTTSAGEPEYGVPDTSTSGCGPRRQPKL